MLAGAQGGPTAGTQVHECSASSLTRPASSSRAKRSLFSASIFIAGSGVAGSREVTGDAHLRWRCTRVGRRALRLAKLVPGLHPRRHGRSWRPLATAQAGRRCRTRCRTARCWTAVDATGAHRARRPRERSHLICIHVLNMSLTSGPRTGRVHTRGR
jgi:hypothetical protein